MSYKKIFRKPKVDNKKPIKIDVYLYEDCLKYLKDVKDTMFYLGLTSGITNFLKDRDIYFAYNDFILQMPDYFKKEMRVLWVKEN